MTAWKRLLARHRREHRVLPSSVWFFPLPSRGVYTQEVWKSLDFCANRRTPVQRADASSRPRLHHHIQGLGYSPGPFSCPEVPCGAGFRPVVLRVGIRHHTPISAFSGRSPSLFSVCAAGRRRTPCRRIRHLRREVQRQLRRPVRCRTQPAAVPGVGVAAVCRAARSGAHPRPACGVPGRCTRNTAAPKRATPPPGA